MCTIARPAPSFSIPGQRRPRGRARFGSNILRAAARHEIDREPGKIGDWYHAVVRHLHAAGPVARLELERLDNGTRIHAQLSRQRQDELRLCAGESAFVRLVNTQTLTDGPL